MSTGRVRVRRVALLVLGALVATTCATRSEDDPPAELERPQLVYMYDGVGRLRAVADPAVGGQMVVYSYDAVGNRLGIDRHPADELSVLDVVPSRVETGTTATIFGSGFATTASDNRVVVGGSRASVRAATAFSLTVVVPDEAESGAVKVTTSSGGSATADAPIQVVPDRVPVVSGFSPTVVAPGDSLTIEGRNFTGDALSDAVVVGGTTYASVTSASPTELVVTVPPTAPSGRVTVATPYGESRSDDVLVVAPLGYRADEISGRSPVSLGAPVDVALSPGQAELVTFTGSRGQTIDLTLDSDGLGCLSVAVGLSDPTGVQLVDPRASTLGIGTGGQKPWCDDRTSDDAVGIALPATGRYTLTVTPRGTDPGSVELTLREGREVGRGEAAERGTSTSTTASDAAASTSTTAGAADPPVDVGQLAAGPGGVLDGVGWLPVDLASGALAFQETDMVVADDLLPVALTRGYWPVADGQIVGEVAEPRGFGLGSALEFDMRVNPSSALQYVELELPSGLPVVFDRTTPGTDRESAVFEHTTTSTGFFGASLTWSGVSWDLRLPAGVVLEFAPAGPLRALRDRNGNATTIQRSAVVDQFGRTVSGNVASVHSPTGRGLAFTYDASDRIVEARNHLGDTVTYGYDERGRLARAVYSPAASDPFEVGYSYDERGLVTAISRSGQPLVAVGYDAAGRVASQRVGEESPYLFAYAVETRPTEIEGVEQEAVTRADVVDPRGSVRRVDFGAGQWTTDTYAAGTPDEQAFTAERDPTTGFVTARIDPDGVRTGYSYDDDGNLVGVTGASATAGESLTAFDYGTDAFDLTSVSGPAGRNEMAYDAAGNLLRSTSYSGVATRFGYDRHGRLTSVRDDLGNTTRVDYGLAHRVTVTDAQGHRYSEFHDAAGRVAARTDPAGNTTGYRYDGFDRVRTVVDPLAGETTYDYDAAGNLVALTDASGQRTSYTYDSYGQVTSRTDPAGAAELFAYDAAGNVAAHTDRRGVRTTYGYDAVGRLVEAAFGVDAAGSAAAESSVRYGYDAAGRLVHVEDSAYGPVDLAYDDLDRLVGETTPQGMVTYGYDAAGRRSTMAIEGGPSTRYRYDGDGMLASLAQGDARVALSRDRLGRVSRIELPNSVTADYSYDSLGGLTGLDYAVDGRTLGDFRYRYDPVGRRSSVAGDLAASSASVPAPVGVDADATAEGFRFDAAGNLLADGTATYTWDARGRLVGVDGEVDATFAYDPFGRRTEKTVDGVTTRYLYDGQNVVRTETDGSTATYLTGPGLDEVFARTLDGEVTSYLTDGLGSVTGLVGSDGKVATRYSYDPFGNVEVRGRDDDPNPFTFTGRELDETGLLYLRARYYSPGQGRFISQDPIGFAGGDPNLYAYAGNDPVNFTDPTGLQAAQLAGLIICAAAGTWFFHVLDRTVDSWRDIAIFDPEAPIPVGSEEARILIDEGSRDILAAAELTLTICSIALAIPGLGGMVGRGATSFGRTVSNSTRTGLAPEVAGVRGPVRFRPPAGATAEEALQVKAYCQACNQALSEGALSPVGRVSTAGELRAAASRAATHERTAAAAAGRPYAGHAGHVPDTTWTGDPNPWTWMDLTPRVNSSLGGQAAQYPLGWKPTEFIFVWP